MLDASEYRKIKSKLEPEIERLASKVSQLSQNDNNEKEIIDFGFYFLRNMSKLFASADFRQKTLYARFDLP